MKRDQNEQTNRPKQSRFWLKVFMQMENNNASDSEEEMYVVLELNDYEKADILSSTKKFSLVVLIYVLMILRVQGLDTETPFLQLDDKVFKGEVENTLGTQIIFEEFLLTKEEMEQRDQQIEQERLRRQQLLQIQKQRRRLQNQIRADSGNVEDDDLDLGINPQDELPEMEKNKSSISHVKLFGTSTRKIKFSRVVLEPKSLEPQTPPATPTSSKKRKNTPSKTSKSSSKKAKASSPNTNNANETDANITNNNTMNNSSRDENTTTSIEQPV